MIDAHVGEVLTFDGRDELVVAIHGDYVEFKRHGRGKSVQIGERDKNSGELRNVRSYGLRFSDYVFGIEQLNAAGIER
ncbi:hypothetical protein CMI37_26810 [Candidatus Pacearchaeota archaeon]|nr:hypothetical protein [Candidatus Pacearchaeota archaeon]|tara:strand:+ start:8531 stop:8764 length:234 start_codon:yes stop_codon:yes gene_type:complete